MTGLLHSDIAAVATARPEEKAVVMGPEQVTYRDLDEASNRLANALRTNGCSPGDRVALLLRKSTEAIIAMIGVLKAGCAYVPLDTQSPASRLSTVIASSRPTALLGHGPTAEIIARTSPRCAIGMMDDSSGATSGLSKADWSTAASAPLATVDPSELAYVMYTSGSTGQPKGVPITHANARHFVDWATSHYGIAAGDRISGHPPLHFDLSVLDVFATLGAGATLHLIPPEASLLPATIPKLIQEQELTQWFSVPSILTYLAKHDAIPATGLPSLQRVLACGEVLPTATLIYWMERVPHARFSNLYGPTEATVASAFHDVAEPPADTISSVPIGKPVPGEELIVLNVEMEPAAPNEIGDLYIGGPGLSPGYWEDPAKTEEAFVSDPRNGSRVIYRTGDLASVDGDGVHWFHGRSDTQIKSRGYRIELGDIEVALSGLDYLLNAVVVAIEDDTFGSVSIGCAFVARPGEEVTTARIRSDLARVLPSYMVPIIWREFVAFPTNRNGKIDRPTIKRDMASNG